GPEDAHADREHRDRPPFLALRGAGRPAPAGRRLELRARLLRSRPVVAGRAGRAGRLPGARGRGAGARRRYHRAGGQGASRGPRGRRRSHPGERRRRAASRPSGASRVNQAAVARWEAAVRLLAEQRARIALGGGEGAVRRQHAKGRLTARERIARLVDDDPGAFQELMAFAGWELYPEAGGAPCGGVVTGLGRIHGRDWMVIANDATVKAGAFFPITAKKVIRAQTIALENRLPTVYLVDSAGVYLPMQDEIFPDQDDFGRVFYLNA